MLRLFTLDEMRGYILSHWHNTMRAPETDWRQGYLDALYDLGLFVGIPEMSKNAGQGEYVEPGERFIRG